MLFKTKNTVASDAKKPPVKTDWKSEAKSYLWLFLGVLAFKSFLWSNHDIPSESMLPGLEVGDRLIVSRFAYGYSRYSVPLLPLPDSLTGRIFARQPERGDVVIFRNPGNDSQIWIKRLIGLPGDTIEVQNGRVILNGKMLPQAQAGVSRKIVEPNYQCVGNGNMLPYRGEGQGNMPSCAVPLVRETLPNNKSYLIFDLQPDATADTYGPVTVPAGHYFMMGDNRDNSMDSRFPTQGGLGGVGMLPQEYVVGRAESIYLSTNGKAKLWEFWNWPKAIRWDRMFTSIK